MRSQEADGSRLDIIRHDYWGWLWRNCPLRSNERHNSHILSVSVGESALFFCEISIGFRVRSSFSLTLGTG